MDTADRASKRQPTLRRSPGGSSPRRSPATRRTTSTHDLPWPCTAHSHIRMSQESNTVVGMLYKSGRTLWSRTHRGTAGRRPHPGARSRHGIHRQDTPRRARRVLSGPTHSADDNARGDTRDQNNRQPWHLIAMYTPKPGTASCSLRVIYTSGTLCRMAGRISMV